MKKFQFVKSQKTKNNSQSKNMLLMIVLNKKSKNFIAMNINFLMIKFLMLIQVKKKFLKKPHKKK